MNVAADRAFSVEANHAALAAAVAGLAARLRQLVQAPQRAADRDAGDPRDTVPALGRLARLFGLSAFEAQVLLLCAAQELDGSCAGLCAQLQGSPERSYPTFGLALAAFDDGHWSALVPTAPLRHWQLVEVLPGPGLAAARLSIAEPVLHYLAGIPVLDSRLEGLLRPVAPPDALSSSQGVAARAIAARWRAPAGPELPQAIEITGDDAEDSRAVAAAAAAEVGVALHAVALPDLPGAPEALASTLRLIERDLAVTGGCLLVEVGDAEPDDSRPARILDQMAGIVVVASRRASRAWRRRRPLTLALARPEGEEERQLWRAVLGSRAPALDGSLARVMGQFRLSSSAIRKVGNRLDASPPPAEAAETELWRACRAEGEISVGTLAQRIQVRARRADLVLPSAQMSALDGLVGQLRHRQQVYEQWGFAARSARGLGIAALFAGPSGTGKTMAAEVVAGELDVDLCRIDLSQVVSKWLGETEKNLARIFEAADAGGAVLLFDEADALFGKRTEVKDSHDRYANVEVSYLLQRMESYRGLAVLTTNAESAIDAGFLRRLRVVVQFPFPDAGQRTEIWRRIFPPQTPVDGLRPERLARLALSGGTIRNVALTAAFLAAAAGEPVRMGHLKHAAEIECAKLKRPIGPAETGDWT